MYKLHSDSCALDHIGPCQIIYKQVLYLIHIFKYHEKLKEIFHEKQCFFSLLAFLD